MFGFYILITSVIVCVAVAGLVISRGLSDSKTRIYALLTFFLLLLSMSNFISIVSSDNQLLFIRLVMISTAAAVYLLYLLVVSLKKRKGYKVFYKTYLFYITIAVVVMSGTDLLFSGVTAGNPATPIPAPGVFLFFAHMLFVVGLAVRLLYHDIKNVHSRKDKRRYRLLIVGILPSVVLAPVTSFILPLLGYNELIVFTPVYVFICTIFVGYAILRYGFLDVQQTVIRTFTYVLTLGTLSAIYFGIAYVFTNVILHSQTQQSGEQAILNVTLALLLAFIFQPVKRFFDHLTNRIFYKDIYSVDEFYSKLNQTLISTTSLEVMLTRTAYLISTTLKAEQAHFFVYGRKDVRPMSTGTQGYKRVPIDDFNILKEYGSDIISITDDLPKEIRRIMISHKLGLFMPLLGKSDIAGFLCLGEHRNSHYTHQDLRVLRTISDELVIAIQNALSVQEVRELNESLEQRIAAATKELRASNAKLQHLDEVKDEFMSMASHQLRTPLTSIKGYISMLLEGDAGKVTKNQTALLSEAFNSSERMVRLIGDFLNVSRLQTGKFVLDKHPVDLAALVQHELSALKQTAISRGHVFEYVQPKEFPMVTIDENKIQQVVMNFSDNALYYSKDPSTIKVSLQVVGESVEFTIKDTGIGVPVDQQEQLFTKFFRATNARKQRPDGTGVGLFLAKKVIDAHHGEMIFSSVEGKGSTFGFRLPIENED